MGNSNGKSMDGTILDRLYKVIDSRKGGDPEKSNTARLFAKGTDKIAQKLGEEAVETVIAAVGGDRQALISESADLLYHWLVVLVLAGVPLSDVLAELERRTAQSGVAEKASRENQGPGGPG